MMKTKTSLICGLIAALLMGMGLTIPQDPSTPSVNMQTSITQRVGTFDSRGVALAYGRSDRQDCMMAKVRSIRRAHDQAKEAGDEDRMLELETQAIALQGEIHEQVFSGAPIEEILALIKDDMPRVARKADVSMIVNGVLYTGPDVQLVDITLQMCAPFEPDGETLKSIRELLAQPPR